MKLFRCLIVIGFVAFAIGNASLLSNKSKIAQAQESWIFTVFSGGDEAALLVIDDTTIVDTIPLSNEIQPEFFYETKAVFTSSDDRYIIHRGLDDVSEQFIYFGETGDGPCCFDLHEQLDHDGTFGIRSFEPEGSRFAISFWTEIDGIIENRMGIVDAATGELVGPLISIEVMLETVEIELMATDVYLGEWTEEGILFFPYCYFCEGMIDEYLFWQPDPFSVTLGSGVYYNDSITEQLELTGEVLVRGIDDAYVVREINFTRNVIEYYDNPDIEDSTATVVYANIETYYAGAVHWIADGQAFLVENTDTEMWDIVYRDGRMTSVEAFNSAEFFSGTPSGWYGVQFNDAGKVFSLYHYDLETLEATLVIDEFYAPIGAVVRGPDLGASVSDLSLTRFEPTWHCPDVLAPQLIIGQNGHITPTFISIIGSYPSFDAEVVGQIHDVDQEFLVLEGPHCDEENGILWWRIEFEGTEGWIRESDNGIYLVEPID